MHTTVMKTISLVSWNVNGVRAIHKKGFLDWLSKANPDILCLQEIRARRIQLDAELVEPFGYHTYWNSAEKGGYGGTALFTRKKPISVEFGLGDKMLDNEGRTIIAEYSDFTLINCYFPNGNRNQERLLFKLKFYEAFLKKCKKLRKQGHRILFCGDLNIAHTEIDLAKPKNNNNKSGFLPEERQWIDKIIKSGFVDTFRHFYPGLSGQYTWWSYRQSSREQNLGWRFDYFFVNDEQIKSVIDAFILPEVTYSDHCPIGIRLEKQCI